MISRKNILVIAALAFWAAPVSAGVPFYSEAAAPWTAQQAVRLPPAITADFLKNVEGSVGLKEAAALAEKKARVSALLGRFRNCTLNSGDLKTAEKYFTPEFKSEIGYFVNGGCAAFRGSASGQAAPAAADISGIEELAASGRLATAEGASRFFDGSSHRSGAVRAVTPGSPSYRSSAPAAAARPSRPISARVPLPPAMREAVTAPGRPANLGEDGRVHQAMAYWSELRRENWNACRRGNLTGAARAKALAKAAAGAGLGGLLYFSNLDNVETAAARLGWDAGSGAGAGVITADAAKLIFHSAVFAMMLAPIPMAKVAKAVLAGEPWAIAFAGAMAAGPVNRYLYHFAD